LISTRRRIANATVRDDQEFTACVCNDEGDASSRDWVIPAVPVQRCWAHKIRNIVNKVRKADHIAVKAGLNAVKNAATLTAARAAARRFADRWRNL
jgi:transposase-like protein